VQAWTVVGGAQQLSVSLARRVQALGGTVILNHAVTSVQRGPPDAAGGGKCIRVTCANGAVLLADVVVCALPPPLIHSLSFSPPLAAHRAHLCEASRMGGIIKAIAVYPTAWWRAHGYSGEVICDTASHPDGGPAFNIFDASAPLLPSASADAWAAPPPPSTVGDGTAAGHSADHTMGIGTPGTPSAVFLAAAAATASRTSAGEGGRGVVGYGTLPGSGAATVRTRVGTMPAFNGATVPALVVFINGAAAAHWSRVDADTRRAAVLRQLRAFFGDDDAALSPVEYVEQDWTQYPYTRGCPIASYGQGALQLLGLHRGLAVPDWSDAPRVRPDGSDPDPATCRLFFAGTETASQGTGFMDGAIRSGWAVAPHVWTALQRVQAEMTRSGTAATGTASGAGAMPQPHTAAAEAPLSAPLLE